MNLRDYQSECLQAIKQRQTEKITRQLVALPTGTGKTVIFAHLPQVLDCRKMLVLAHREELLDQAKEKIQNVHPDLEVQVEQAERHANQKADVIVASTATLGRQGSPRLQAFDPQEWPLIICDEAHHSIASTYRNIFDHFQIGEDPSKLLVGFTATPSRGDKVGLDTVYQDIVYQKDIRHMIEAGWLCPILGYRLKTGTDISAVHVQQGDFAEGELSQAVDIVPRNQLAVEAYQTYCPGRRALVFCVDKAHTLHMAEAFQDKGITCGIVLGETPAEERAETLDRLKEGSLKGVANCMVLTEGFDLPSLSAIIMARPTRSGLLYTQAIGRGTRTSPNKENLIVIDLTDNSRLHQLISLPVLFGLPPEFDLKGKSVLPTLQELEEIAQNYPRLPLTRATSLAEARALIEQFDILSGQVDEPVLRYSRLAWVAAGDECYSLFLKGEAGRRNQKLAVRRNLLGKYELHLLTPGLGSQRLALLPDLATALAAGDHYLQTNFPEKMGLYLQSARWRQELATEKQKYLLNKLGAPVREGLTKGEAQYLIASLLEQRNQTKVTLK